MTDRTELRDLLLAIRDLLLELVEIERRKVPAAVAATSTAAPLVTQIRLHLGARAFNSADVLTHAALPDAGPLLAAIEGAVRIPSARAIMAALNRLEGIGVDGYALRRIGDDRDGAVFAINAISDTADTAHPIAGAAVPSAPSALRVVGDTDVR